MKFKLEESLELFNARAKQQDWNKMTKSRLGELLYPDADKPYVNVWQLMNKEVASVRLDHIQVICKELRVDANFLFGFPSKHDIDYQKLVRK